MNDLKPIAAIVDYGLGNLYSVGQACAAVGLNSIVTRSKAEIWNADAVILPGVGAYGDAVSALNRLDLAIVLKDIGYSGKPLVGICLGLQLLMTESYEFGRHKGLGIIEGPVALLDQPKEGDRLLKVPQIGWNKIYRVNSDRIWDDTLLEGIEEGEYMYFVHSYSVRPKDISVILSATRYGHIEYCSAVQYGNVFGCQFHPERSGSVGLQVYRNLALSVTKKIRIQRSGFEHKDALGGTVHGKCEDFG